MEEEPEDEIRRIMQEEGMSFRDVDARGYSMASLVRVLRGSVSPTWKTIQKIANALGYTSYVVFKRK